MKIWRVAAGIVWHGELCLMAKRPEGSLMSGYYEFPGGKIEPGETAYDAMVRELHEEMSINVIRGEYWRTLNYSEREWRGVPESVPIGYEEWRVNIDFFHVVEYTGRLKANEGQEWLFVLPVDALKLNLLPANISLVERLARAGAARQRP